MDSQKGRLVFNRKHTKEEIEKMKENHADVSGEKNPNFKGGNWIKPKCIDCGKELVNPKAKRCQKCMGFVV